MRTIIASILLLSSILLGGGLLAAPSLPTVAATDLRGLAAQSPSLDETLPNGLRVLVYEDRRAPTALHMVWLQAGSMDEINGKTGLAHVLEHMMFKGTKALAPGEFSKRVAALGGRENAFTSRDYTAYFQQVHRQALFEVMALEADRMQDLSFSDETFAKELQVVMEERRLRTDDSASGRAFEALMAHALTASPHRRPVIGWMSDLKSLTAQDAREWYQTWYAPNNATLIVAGDVNAQAVRDEAARLYAGWARKPLPDRRPQSEPEQLGERQVTVSAPAENPFFIRAWRVPTVEGQQAFVSTNPVARQMASLTVLSKLLDSPDLGRLQQALVRDQQTALSVSAGAPGFSRGPGLFYLEATPKPGVRLDALDAAVQTELQKIAAQGVTPDELAIIIRQERAQQIFRQDSLFSRAMEAGQLATASRPLDDAGAWLSLLETVTSQDVQAAVQLLLNQDQSTRVNLRPLPLETASRRGMGPNLLRH